MFLSEISKKAPEKGAIYPATVTVSADTSAVYTDGEKRDVLIISPMGYIWRPEVGQDIFVIKESSDAAGYILAAPMMEEKLSAGDIMIKNLSGDSILLRRSGGIEIKGNVVVSGSLYAAGGVIGGGDENS